MRVAGVDEAGRGPLAGPVVAAACLLPPHCSRIEGVRDSKLLSTPQRERLLREITQEAIAVGIGAASVREIDDLNILQATHLAMRRALRRLGQFDHALIDGRDSRALGFCSHTAIVGGDARCYTIACASIVAKVVRDRLMRRLAQLFPGYGWERNAGYATVEHLAALTRLGPTSLHRRSFDPLRTALEQGRLDL